MRPAVSTLLLLLLLCLALPFAACESAKPHHQPTRERPTAANAKELFKKVELEFEAGTGPEFEAVITECCKDDKLAASVARLMMFHMTDAARRQREKQAGQFQLRDLESNYRYTRARGALTRMGPKAVPTVIDELLKHRFTDNRRIGAQILSAMPKEVLPTLRNAAEQSEPKIRRHYVAAVAGMKPSPEGELLLLEWSKSKDYDVRAAALEGLANFGDRHLTLLHDAVAHDSDPFVQRQVVKVLSRYKDRRTAAAVIGYYSRAEQRHDRQGIREAERAMIKISGKPPSKGRRFLHYGLKYWRQWVLTLPVDGGNR